MKLTAEQTADKMLGGLCNGVIDRDELINALAQAAQEAVEQHHFTEKCCDSCYASGATAMREACANKIEINTCGDKDCDHDVCVSIRAQMAMLRSLPLPGAK